MNKMCQNNREALGFLAGEVCFPVFPGQTISVQRNLGVCHTANCENLQHCSTPRKQNGQGPAVRQVTTTTIVVP